MPRTVWPPYRTLRSLVHAQHGRTAVIMGGGPTLPAAIAQCPPDALYISVNDHGVRLLKDQPILAPRACTYVVACDKLEERWRTDIRDKQPWGLPVISRHMWADYRLLAMPAPSSGMSAAWFARLLGCSPIILTGMDLYNGSTYFDNKQGKSTGSAITDRQHLQRWVKLVNRYPAMYRTLGCSPLLQERVGVYCAHTPIEPPATREQVLADLSGSWVRLGKEAMISMRTFQAGEVLELVEGEAARVIKEGKALRLKSGE